MTPTEKNSPPRSALTASSLVCGLPMLGSGQGKAASDDAVIYGGGHGGNADLPGSPCSRAPCCRARAARACCWPEDYQGIATQLSRGGYRVDHVLTGREALSRGDPDIVLLDLGLPDIDGVHVRRRLREGSGAAIIVVTARGEETERVLALDAGASFARSDRSRRLRFIRTDERLVEGPGQRLTLTQRADAVRTDEHQPRGD